MTAIRNVWAANKERALFVVSTVLLLAGGAAWLLSASGVATALWIAGTVLGLVFSVGWTVTAIRAGQLSVDVIAVLALAGALVVNEPFAGAMITVMLASGQLLEARAGARARRELSLLVDRAPRYGAAPAVAGTVVDGPGGRRRARRPADRGSGEIVAGGRPAAVPAVLDESALTGEPLPVERIAGDDVRSGVVNAGQPIDLLATASRRRVHLRRRGPPGRAGAGLVGAVRPCRRPVRHLSSSRSRCCWPGPPGWSAVTPSARSRCWWSPRRARCCWPPRSRSCPGCPAPPVSASSSRVVPRWKPLAGGRVMLFDKTGTLTQGRPQVGRRGDRRRHVDADEVLRLAASLDQVSPHVLAGAIVTAGTRRGLPLKMPDDVHEVHGYGLEGHRRRAPGQARQGSPGSSVTPPPAVGPAGAPARRPGRLARRCSSPSTTSPPGRSCCRTPIRPDAPRMVRALRTGGHRPGRAASPATGPTSRT